MLRLVCALMVAAAGCRLPPPPSPDDLSRGWTREESVAVQAAEQLSRQRQARAVMEGTDGQGCEAFAGTPDASELTEMEAVVAEVLRVNDSLAASESAWKAAMELYPQARSWNDPNLRFQNGPTIFGDSQGAHLWRLQVSQGIPWFGKTGLRGEVADRTADVAFHQWRQTRQSLAGLARKTYIEYARSEQLHQLRQEDYRLAKAALEPPPTVAQAAWDLESMEKRETYEIALLELEQQQQELVAARQRAQEQLNVLLHRNLDAPLPPAEVPALPQIPEPSLLEEKAFQSSPQLAIAKYQQQQAEASRQLAEKEFYPDIKMVGRFDTNASDTWAPHSASLKPQLGVYFDPPLQQGRRWAKLREMELTRQRRQAEARAIESTIRNNIHRTVSEIERSRKRLASLDRLIATARRAEIHATLVATRESGSRHVAAERTVLKYEMKKLEEEFDLRQQLNELATLTEA